MNKKLIFLLIFILLNTVAVAQQDSISNALFNKAFNLFSTNSVKKVSIDWDSLYVKYSVELDKIQSLQDTYDLIDSLIEEINDGHSFLYYPGKPTSWTDSEVYPESTLISKMIDSKTGYIRIPSINVQGQEELANKSKAIRDKLCRLLNNEPKFLIVDLSRDFGGNMYPMFLGVQPILGQGTVGYFERAPGDRTPWNLNERELLFGENSILKVDSIQDCTRAADLKMAVIINEFTISSGEALAVAFQDAPNTIFIGTPTQGATTANQTFYLSDNAMLFLAGATYMDRTFKRYNDPIVPDIHIPCDDCPTEEFDKMAIEAAMKWFKAK